MNHDFKAFAEDLNEIEVLNICINNEGEFFVKNELKGRIARVPSQRGRLREFLLGFCERLNCPEHASEPKAIKHKAGRSAASA